VLIVDDNATNRRLLTRHVQAWGMLTRDTASGLQALDWIRQNEPFDVALVDMYMPEMDGLTLAREIRNYRDVRTLQLVMLSSVGQREEGTGEVEASIVAHLTKPIKPFQLRARLLRIFEEPASANNQEVSPRQINPQLAHQLPLRILVAEDNPVNQKVALRILERMGYRADLASNGLEVIDALGRQSYDVVLMDVQMPEMDGLEATHYICQKWSTDERPRIIAMTANAMQGDRDKCVVVGMDDYISKPVNPLALQEVLKRWGQPMVKAMQRAS
jgi:CheY-like chemotaxis protein